MHGKREKCYAKVMNMENENDFSYKNEEISQEGTRSEGIENKAAGNEEDVRNVRTGEHTYMGGNQNMYGYGTPNGNAYAYGASNGTYTYGTPSGMTGATTNPYVSPYQSPYGAQNGTSYSYTRNNEQAYGQAMGQTDIPGNNNKKAKKKKEKGEKRGSFGATLGKCAAIALVFGLVAGGIFTGVSYAGMKALGISAPASSSAVSDVNDKLNGPLSDGDTSPNTDAQPAAPVSPTATGSAKDILSVSDIVDEVMPGIVAITNTSMVSYQSFFGGYQQYEAESRGSGIIVKQDDEYLYIATNNHVVSGAETLSVQFFNDVSVSGEIQGTYASNDLAVVKVALKDVDSDTLSQIRMVTLGDSDALKVGEGTIAIGNALGYGQSVTTGIVSALHRSITVSDSQNGATTTCDNLIQTDAAINPGNSGGALLDASGALIGINSAKYADTDVEGIGYAIPINDAMEVVNALIAGENLEKTQTAYLGIGGSDVSSDVASAYGLPEGVYVKSVYPGSGADEAGICQGDIITGVDGKEIKSMTELQGLLMDYSAGDTVSLTVWRMNNGYQSMEVSVTLTDASVLGSANDGNNSGNGTDGNTNGNNNGNGNNGGNGYYGNGGSDDNGGYSNGNGNYYGDSDYFNDFFNPFGDFGFGW